MEIVNESEKELIVRYNADDEDPKCIACANVLADEECCYKCEQTGWSRYYRDIIIPKVCKGEVNG